MKHLFIALIAVFSLSLINPSEVKASGLVCTMYEVGSDGCLGGSIIVRETFCSKSKAYNDNLAANWRNQYYSGCNVYEVRLRKVTAEVKQGE